MKKINPDIHWLDLHTHRKNHPDDVFFIRNAFIPKDPELTTRLNYPVSCGLHPWQVNANWPVEIAALEKVLVQNSCVMIGECGMDIFRSGTRKQQRDAFDAQIQLAKTYHLPVVIHQVRMLPDILQQMKRTSGVQFILHGFHGNQEELKQCLKYPVWFSLGNFVLRANSMQQAIVRAIPEDRLFFETDTASISIKTIYATAAAIRNTEIDVLRIQTLRNFTHLLNES
jgi:TatD DNase family protein